MTGLCGWIGESGVAAADGILQRMGSALCRFDHSRLSTNVGPLAALAVAGDERTATLFADGSTQLALSGHPRWEHGDSHLTDIHAICPAFLDAYRSEGPEVLKALKGDFAFALFDSERHEALLAIDRIGIRNLVYQETRGGLIFGSTADALAAHPDVRR